MASPAMAPVLRVARLGIGLVLLVLAVGVTKIVVAMMGVLPVVSEVDSGCEVEESDSVNGEGEGGNEVDVELVDVDVTELDGVVVGGSVVLEVVLEEVVVEEVVVEEVVVEDVVVVDPAEDEAESKQLVSSLGWIVRGPALATWLALSRSKKETVCPAGTGKTQGKPSPVNG